LAAKGSCGHFSEDDHLTLIEQVKEIMPEGLATTARYLHPDRDIEAMIEEL